MAYVWKAGTMPNPHLVWMSILDVTKTTGRKHDPEAEDNLTFWLRTLAVVTTFACALTAAGTYLFVKFAGG